MTRFAYKSLMHHRSSTYSRRIFAISTLSLSMTARKGDLSDLRIGLQIAPFDSSTLIISVLTLLHIHASNKAELPFLFCRFTSAPRRIRVFTASIWLRTSSCHQCTHRFIRISISMRHGVKFSTLLHQQLHYFHMSS